MALDYFLSHPDGKHKYIGRESVNLPSYATVSALPGPFMAVDRTGKRVSNVHQYLERHATQLIYDAQSLEIDLTTQTPPIHLVIVCVVVRTPSKADWLLTPTDTSWPATVIAVQSSEAPN